MASEELLQRRLTRAKLALGALRDAGRRDGDRRRRDDLVLALVPARAVGRRAFARGPYLLRVGGSEAALRWSVRGERPVTRGRGRARRQPRRGRGGSCAACSRARATPGPPAWTATAHAGGSFTTPPRTLDRPVRFAVLGDYGSGNDDEWAVGRVLAAQRPDFTVTAGDNSYLVAAEMLLDRNIFRPLADLMRSAPFYVCLGDHDTFFPGPGALSRAFDLPEGGRFAVRHGPIQVVVLGDEPNEAAAVAFAGTALREPGPELRFVVCHRPLQAGDAILPGAARGRRHGGLLRPPAPLRAPRRRGCADVHGRHGRTGARLARPHPRHPGAAVSLLDIGALMVEVRPGGTVGYTYLDKHGSVLDRGVSESRARALLATLLGIGVAGLAVLPEPGSWLLALAIMLLAFLVVGAKLAVDLIELVPVDLVADAAALLAVGIALSRVTTGNRLLVTTLLALALVAQALPLASARAGNRRTPRA